MMEKYPNFQRQVHSRHVHPSTSSRSRISRLHVPLIVGNTFFEALRLLSEHLLSASESMPRAVPAFTIYSTVSDFQVFERNQLLEKIIYANRTPARFSFEYVL